VDTISHSMGTCITRYFLEVMDRAHHAAHVRQLIGLGPRLTTGLLSPGCSTTRNTGQRSSTA
jgi:hypothetical protein